MGSGYYFYSTIVMNKGKEMKLGRVLNIFKAVDLSNNRFEGEIPESIGNLKSLIASTYLAIVSQATSHHHWGT